MGALQPSLSPLICRCNDTCLHGLSDIKDGYNSHLSFRQVGSELTEDRGLYQPQVCEQSCALGPWYPARLQGQQATPFQGQLPHSPSQWPGPLLSAWPAAQSPVPRCVPPPRGTRPPPWRSQCSPRQCWRHPTVSEAQEQALPCPFSSSFGLCCSHFHQTAPWLPPPAALSKPSAGHLPFLF